VALIFAAFSFKAVNQMDNNTITSSDAVKTTPQNSEATNSVSKLTDIVMEKPAEAQTGSVVKNKADTLKKSTISFVPGIGQVYAQVEQMPQFPGGEKEMIKFIRDNLKYPVKAMEMGVSGTVIVNFVVGRDGTISRIKVMRGIGSGCDEEAIRVLEKMPAWSPGKQGGKAEPVSYIIPVKFVLGSGNSKPGEPAVKYGSQQKMNVDSLLLSLQNIEDPNQPVILIDGRVAKRSEIKPEDIAYISVLKNESAIRYYGEKAKNGVILVTSKQEEKRQTVDGERAFVIVEQMPQFPGGETEMRKFINENLKYPEEAKKKNIQGTTIVNFVIDKEGRIRNPSVMRSLDESMSIEALRILNLMPAWTPGKQGGKAVNVSYTVPFKFVMN
jgi:TonB family protein